MKNSKFQRYFTLFVICLGASLIYKVPYLREAFYTPLKDALGVSHEQVGALSTMYGTIALLAYFPGGILADKISTKLLMVVSFVATGVLALWFATMPSYGAVKFIYGAMGVTSILTFWSAFVKTVRILGGEDEQGKMFGLSEGIRSISSTVLSFAVLGIIGSAVTQVGGLQTTLAFYGAFLVVLGIACIFLLEPDKRERSSKSSMFSLTEVVQALKLPGLWMVMVLIFAWYSIYSASSYTTPYLTEVFGLPLSVVGTLSIIRSYGMGIFSGPLAGFVSDKVGSPTKVLVWSSIAAIAVCALLLMFPMNSSMIMIPMILMLALGFIVFAARGTYFATLQEAKIPLALTGVASGLISVVGYSPDMFFFTMAGKWLDQYGTGGYRFIFIYMVGCAVVALVTGLAILRYSKKATIESSVDMAA